MIDVQERLVPVIHAHQAVVREMVRVITGARLLSVPVVASVQYPRGLGPLVPAVAAALGGVVPVEKAAFSCMLEPAFVDALRATERDQVIVVGIEAHVCVAQTVLDLLARGWRVQVVADAVSSRTPENAARGIARCAAAGAVVTSTEAVLFDWLETSGTDAFRAISALVKDTGATP